MVSHPEPSNFILDGSGALSQQEHGARSKLLVDDVDLVILKINTKIGILFRPWQRIRLYFGGNSKGRKEPGSLHRNR